MVRKTQPPHPAEEAAVDDLLHIYVCVFVHICVHYTPPSQGSRENNNDANKVAKCGSRDKAQKGEAMVLGSSVPVYPAPKSLDWVDSKICDAKVALILYSFFVFAFQPT